MKYIPLATITALTLCSTMSYGAALSQSAFKTLLAQQSADRMCENFDKMNPKVATLLGGASCHEDIKQTVHQCIVLLSSKYPHINTKSMSAIHDYATNIGVCLGSIYSLQASLLHSLPKAVCQKYPSIKNCLATTNEAFHSCFKTYHYPIPGGWQHFDHTNPKFMQTLADQRTTWSVGISTCVKQSLNIGEK